MKLKKSSDIDSFEQIVSRCQDRLFRFAFIRIGNRQIAEDLVQEVLIRLFNVISNGKIIDDPEFFLIRSISNACIDYHRKKKYQMLSFDELNENLIEADLEINEEFLRVKTILDGLPDSQAETIMMKCYDGLTFRQIAEIQEMTESTVKSRYRYAIQLIRKKLEL